MPDVKEEVPGHAGWGGELFGVEGGRELKGQDAGNPDDRGGKRELGGGGGGGRGGGGAWGQGLSALSPIAE